MPGPAADGKNPVETKGQDCLPCTPTAKVMRQLLPEPRQLQQTLQSSGTHCGSNSCESSGPSHCPSVVPTCSSATTFTRKSQAPV
eukprot:5573256-Amphidinium_carterae.1